MADKARASQLGVTFRKGTRYQWTHKRKGEFQGVFLAKEKTDPEDGADAEFLTVAMDTSDGSGAEWLRRTVGAEVTVSNLRPSLITGVKRVEAQRNG
jgi:hypothetical protein